MGGNICDTNGYYYTLLIFDFVTLDFDKKPE